MTVIDLPRCSDTLRPPPLRSAPRTARSTSIRKRLPDFMIIGAAKSATTSLHAVLQQHPQVWMSTPKEPTFFSNPLVNELGMDWYHRLFAQAGTDQICGEASTTYMRYPFAEAPNDLDPWGAIAELDHDMRFIYMVRHPVDRAYSHYVHHMRTGCRMTFEEAIASNSIYVDTSRYEMQLEHFRRHMPDAPLLIMEFEGFKNQTMSACEQVFDFLGVEPCGLDGGFETHRNGKGPEYYISALAHRIPMVSRTKKVVPPRIWSGMRKALHASPLRRIADRRSATPPMLPDTRRRLLEFFEPDVVAIEARLGRSLEHWRV